MRVCVIGSGVMGAWTGLWLRRRGAEVTLLDAYGPGNSLSSSGDESRVTRSAHGPDEHYPAWQRRALEHWRDLESPAGEPLFVPTGVLWLAHGETGPEADSLGTLQRLGIPAQRLDPAALAGRWPQLRSDDVSWGLYEPEGGVLMARRATAAVARALVQAGGSLVRARAAPPGSSVHRLTAVELAEGSGIQADAFVFACGPWLARLFPDLPVAGQLAVTRQEVVYLAPPPGDGRFDAGSLPVWVDYGAAFYGLPSIEARGMKVAPDRPGPIIDPDTEEREPGPTAVRAAQDFVRHRFPAMAGRPVVEARVCQYESTPDAHFIIDRHPALDNAWIVGGGSGHAFKHGPVIGEYAAALVVGDEPGAAALAPPDKRFALAPRTVAGAGLRTAAAEQTA